MLNIRETEDSKVYFLSDPHLGHNKEFVYGSRGFSSFEEHDLGVIESINATVRPTDKLFMLGDFCLNTTLEKFNWYLDQIKCQNIYALFGNHNNPHEMKIYTPLVKQVLGDKYEEGSQVYPLRYKNMIFMGHYLEAILGGQYVVLAHYPYSIWNEQQHGAWMLCGHSHYNFPQTKADNLYGKILDVGWDGHKKPWSLEEIANVMNGKRFISQDHHN